MPGLDDADLDYVRRVQDEHLPEQGSREQRLTVADGMGGQDETWLPVPGTFGVRVTDASPDLPADLAARLKGNDGYTLTIPTGVAMGYRDRITVGGRRFEVLALDARGRWNTAQRLTCVPV